jgi:uncharacterized protein
MELRYTLEELMQAVHMVAEQNFDIRTVTMGINLKDCIDTNLETFRKKIYRKITEKAGRLVEEAALLEAKYGIPIVNKRIAVTPIALTLEAVLANAADKEQSLEIAVAIGKTLDDAAKEIGIDFIAGFSALVHKGATYGDTVLIDALPLVLSQTERLCGSVNVASTRAGINMDSIARLGVVIKDIARKTPLAIGCAKFVCFANAVEDNPFVAGAFHGIGEADTAINIGISGPGVVKHALEQAPQADLTEVAEIIKKTAFRITRVGELIGREIAKRLQVSFGIVDLSLAPTPAMGDSVAEILEVMGVAKVGAPGSTVALALLVDAVKKGGMMASSSTGGLSGAFIPVSEDGGMVEAIKVGALSLEKLEAMTAVCSVGLDMIAVPGDTPASTIAAIIADECAIGVMNNKTTGVRIIPVPQKQAGDYVSWGGLLGGSYILPVNRFSADRLIARGGRMPAPIVGNRN